MVIERPKRSVTRFFVPLIDVLILLFCIFLVLPFVSQPADAPEEHPSADTAANELPKDMVQLQAELERARRELKKLRAEQANVGDRLSVCVVEVDPKTGGLFAYRDGERIDLPDQKAVEELITVHKRHSGTRDPFFMILFPRQLSSGLPNDKQRKDYIRWFDGTQYRIDDPFK